MGTRSLTTFIEKWTDEKTQKKKQVKIVTMYRQYDGYPTGHGLQLAEFLSKGKIVNGIPFGEDGVFFNGMGCLAAQCVEHFKEGPGNIYLYRGGVKGCWEEYHYEVVIDNSKPKEVLLKCFDIHENRWVFKGTPKNFIEKYQEVKTTADKG
jgi:hypothetical protein